MDDMDNMTTTNNMKHANTTNIVKNDCNDDNKSFVNRSANIYTKHRHARRPNGCEPVLLVCLGFAGAPQPQRREDNGTKSLALQILTAHRSNSNPVASAASCTVQARAHAHCESPCLLRLASTVGAANRCVLVCYVCARAAKSCRWWPCRHRAHAMRQRCHNIQLRQQGEQERILPRPGTG